MVAGMAAPAYADVYYIGDGNITITKDESGTYVKHSGNGDLSDLTDLRSENIKTVVFSTVSCTSTLSLSDVAALGAGSTPFALSHSGSTATFTVGGADHSALLR